MRRTTRGRLVAAAIVLAGGACATGPTAPGPTAPRPVAAGQIANGATAAARYVATRDGAVVRLEDRARQTIVSVIPSAGNIAVELRVRGHNVLRFPHASPEEFLSRPPGSRGGGASMGIPFLAPWADRLDEQAFYANGQRYAFDMGLGNVRGTYPIHGFLSAVEWRETEAVADGTSARVTSRLEFHRQPRWMKQFPFAHTIEMTHVLQDGVLEVATRIRNLSTEPMPVAIGFHPYFQLTDSPRDEWTIALAARTHWPLTADKMPTGTTQPIEAYLGDPQAVPLKAHDLDDVFTDLVRDERGQAVMRVQGKSQRLEVALGENYRAVVVYAPKPQPARPGSAAQDRNFVCFEPVSAIINGLNLAHRGVYKELQQIPPDGSWEARFWVRPSGF